MAAITTLQEWHLLVGVCPLFECKIPWTPHIKQHLDEIVVEEAASSLATSLGVLKAIVVVPGEEPLDDGKSYEFLTKIRSLLSTLEGLLLQDVTSQEVENQVGHQSYPKKVLTTYPKLVALDRRIQACRDDTLSIAELCKFVRLEQEAQEFKSDAWEVKHFIDVVISILPVNRNITVSTKARAARPVPSAARARSKISSSFQDHSNRLFKSLVDHIKPCISGGSNQKSHRAMLNLGHLDHEGELMCKPELYMHLSSCPDGEHWQQVHCSVLSGISDEEANESMDSAQVVETLCVSAQIAHSNDQILRIQLVDELGLLDISNFRFRPERPGAIRSVSLLHLLEKGRLKYLLLEDRRILAFTLAHALLNLHDSPWLQSFWALDNIFFLCGTDGTTYNIHQPHVGSVLSCDTPTTRTMDVGHGYPMVLCFAKLLREIGTGELVPIETYRTNKKGEASLLVTLQDYYERKGQYELSPAYREALRACILFPTYMSLSKTRHRDSSTAAQHLILERIVHKLESEVNLELRGEWGKRVPKLDLQPLDTDPSIARPSTELKPPYPIIKDDQPKKGPGSRDTPRIRPASRATASGMTGPNPSQSSRSQLHQLSVRSSSPAVRAASNAPSKLKDARKLPQHRVRPEKGQCLPANRSTASSTTKRSTPSLTTRQERQTPRPFQVPARSDTNYDGFEFSNIPNRPSNHADVTSTFGCMHLLSTSDTETPISSKTFQYLNDAVQEYWQPWPGDEPIKIAILDTGFDFDHPDFELAQSRAFLSREEPQPEEEEQPSQKKRVIDSRNFCSDDPQDISDIDGHGTQVAGIILRLVPHAHVYIARVCTGDANRGLGPDETKQVEKNDSSTPQVKAVQEAIKWALEKKVDVINMSLGFRGSIVELNGVREALQEAQTKKVVVFAATSNEGLHEPVAWPANDRQYAIGVHSCVDSGGKPSDFSAKPSSHGANFMVVGENILSQWITTKGGGFRIASGSSFAAPVASAIGALVLQFVFQMGCRKHKKTVEAKIPLDDIRTNVGMAKVLHGISTDVDGYRSIHARLFWHDLLFGHDAKAHAWNIIERALSS